MQLAGLDEFGPPNDRARAIAVLQKAVGPRFAHWAVVRGQRLQEAFACGPCDPADACSSFLAAIGAISAAIFRR
jgi:hypothetical protein